MFMMIAKKNMLDVVTVDGKTLAQHHMEFTAAYNEAKKILEEYHHEFKLIPLLK